MKKHISIITINFNNAEGLKRTIESVVKQGYRELEYIIIDGGSTDESLNVIKTHQDNISYWISEPDNGIYNAMNKGIAKATGDYLLFLNGGDYLVDDNIISRHLEVFDNKDFVAFDVMHNIPNVGEKRHSHPEDLHFSFLYNETFAHQGVFIKRELFDKVGYYDETLKIVSDWKFFIDAVVRHNASYKRIPEILSYCVLDGVSATKEGTLIRKKERQAILKEDYSIFNEDYKNLAYFKLNRFKALRALERYSFTRKLNSIWLHILLIVVKGKTPKQLK